MSACDVFCGSQGVKCLPLCLTPAESDDFADQISGQFSQHGFGKWAIERPRIAPFVGYVGLSIPSLQAHFTPCVEIGWRLARGYWENGYAPEGAREVLRFGFSQIGLEEIVSFTVPANIRSRRVMEGLAMHHSSSDDFDHPQLPDGDPLRRHVLYRLTMADWQSQLSDLRHTIDLPLLKPASPRRMMAGTAVAHEGAG